MCSRRAEPARHAHTTAPDSSIPSGSGEAYWYPAAGRVHHARGSDMAAERARVAWKVADALFLLMFVFSVIVQVNDPDPLSWMAIYGAAAVACLLSLMGRLPWWFAVVTGIDRTRVGGDDCASRDRPGAVPRHVRRVRDEGHRSRRIAGDVRAAADRWVDGDPRPSRVSGKAIRPIRPEHGVHGFRRSPRVLLGENWTHQARQMIGFDVRVPFSPRSICGYPRNPRDPRSALPDLIVFQRAQRPEHRIRVTGKQADVRVLSRRRHHERDLH